ncbi:unnamed protein product, partial [Mesorhabditis belari]|uniref:protein acetyllysine N-acetyltransferase n=1 Tax=Mesorhabditis belari TaxID=2138241 RepID=A0AAF3F4D1_9BILA
MAVNYSDCLSPYDNKGKVGMPEIFDKEEDIERKCGQMAEWIQEAKHLLVITGAGISTSAGIADFRGPKGVWTLEKQGKNPESIDFCSALPTYTHHALKRLEEHGFLSYLVSQNVDGLHLRSGFPLNRLAELHGNVFAEQCIKCRRRYYRTTPVESFCLRPTGNFCEGTPRGRPCRGALHDMTLDWEHDLPEPDFTTSSTWAQVADLCICLGTSLQIVPVVNSIFKAQFDQERKVDLAIHARVDEVMKKVMMRLGLDTVKSEGDGDDGDGDVCVKREEDFVMKSKRPLENLKTLLKEKTKRKRKHSEGNELSLTAPEMKPETTAEISNNASLNDVKYD